MSQEEDINLDLRGVKCPFNFVKTKLKLEAMSPGQILKVTLDPGEPIKNVPRSAQEEGHEILSISERQDGLFDLRLKKASA